MGRARSTPVGWVFVVIANTGDRATVGRVRDPAGGGSRVVVAICYNIQNFNDKPIGLYRMMLLIFCRDGYGAIRTRPPPKKK